ncbi:MAG: hypothetical protein JWO26_1231, partial [Rhodospirillales bacterium]|nr:hypothetical protein [Rhodospirillales bacterium]
MVRPALRRDVVGVLRGTYGISERRACLPWDFSGPCSATA